MFAATFLPASRLGLVIDGSLTTSPLKSAPGLPVVALPGAIALIGTPLLWAMRTDGELLKPNWYWPAATPGMMFAPPAAVSSFRSMFCSLKKPFFCPR